MATLKRGDIVLVPFPFTDLSSTKVRPAVIVSTDPQETDVTVAFISSAVPDAEGPFDKVLGEESPDFPKTGLKRSSVFRMSKLVTLERTTILRRLGRTSVEIQKQLDGRLMLALGLSQA